VTALQVYPEGIIRTTGEGDEDVESGSISKENPGHDIRASNSAERMCRRRVCADVLDVAPKLLDYADANCTAKVVV
jgi:hypothetical protein